MLRTTTRPRMTASEARSFSRYSIGNAAQVKATLKCGCEPYQDVFTYGRWQALGFQVQRGEHSLALPVIVERMSEDDAEKVVRLFRTARVFCRHQVKATGGPRQDLLAPSPKPSDPPPAPQPVIVFDGITPKGREEERGFVANVMNTWKEL